MKISMKKLFLIPLMLFVALCLTPACSDDNPVTDEPEQGTSGGSEDNGNPEEPGNVEGSNSRYLVLYCSRSGNTERMAQTIQSALDCDMIEVVPETPYDEDYNSMLERAQSELSAIRQGTYPAIATSVESFEDYDIVFVGYPIWYGSMATPMQSFLHNHANLLAGKRIALFASSGSSGISTSVNEAHSLLPAATFTESLHLTSSTLGDMENRIPAWLEQLGASREEEEEVAVTGNSIQLTLENGTVFTATLVENSSTQALKELLAEGDITIEMSDYANMEKVGPIGTSLPRNDEHITTSAGDLILYQGNSFVIYYAPNTYSFTRLGKIDNVSAEDLREALGEGDVTVTLSLNRQ